MPAEDAAPSVLRFFGLGATLTVLWVLAPGCKDEAPAVACELEPEVAMRGSGKGAVDCGVLRSDESGDAYQRAHDCVLEAQENGHPFRLIHRLQGTDSLVAAGYAWPGGEGFASILHYDSDPSGGSGAGAIIDEETCDGLEAEPGCAVSAATLCLVCSQRVELSIACMANVPASGECRGSGNYQVGKEGGYQPCCAGLREVFQQSFAEVNGAPGCWEPPLRVYACVQGSCGDGRCEEPEAVPCGCALDCPSAVVATPQRP